MESSNTPSWWFMTSFLFRARYDLAGDGASRLWVYHQLLSKYLATDGYFDFGRFRLPCVKPHDQGVFAFEFGDVVAPFLYPDCPYWNEGPYESGEVRIHSGDVVIDAGANMGMFSAAAASRGACVYAFEPMPQALDYLETTRHLNSHLSGRINVVPLALMDTSQPITITDEPGNMGSSSAVLPRPGSGITVPATSLDEWVNANGISKVDFIKADIEGAERNLLSGAKDVLRRFKPRLSICTYHSPDDPEVLEELIMSANANYVVRHGSHKLYAL